MGVAIACLHALRNPTPNRPDPRDCLKCGRKITAADVRPAPRWVPPERALLIYSDTWERE